MTVAISTRFSAAHFYHQPAWDEERNRREFGRCFHPHGHGHDYKLEAVFADEKPEFLERLKRIVHSVADRLDHQHLNHLPEFRDLVPTTENIALQLWKDIAATNPPLPLKKLRLYEREDIWVEVEP